MAGGRLLAAGISALLRPWTEQLATRILAHILAASFRLLEVLAPLAVLGTPIARLSDYGPDDIPILDFTPSLAYGGAVDSGLSLA